MNPVRAGIVKSPDEYKWSSYRVYAEGENNGIIDINPEYEGLSENSALRRERYKEYIKDGVVEKRKEDRFFRDGVYGSKEFMEKMKEQGLKPVWSHGGKPKKKE